MATAEQLFEKLKNLRGSKTVIVGIGNILKGDDGLGLLVCQKLQSAKISAKVIDTGTVPENYIQPIVKQAPQNLITIDAIDSGVSPGTISIFEPHQLSSFAFSTHILSPHLFIEMICSQIDVGVYIIGIQPEQTQFGQVISAEVDKTIQLLARVLSEIFPPAE